MRNRGDGRHAQEAAAIGWLCGDGNQLWRLESLKDSSNTKEMDSHGDLENVSAMIKVTSLSIISKVEERNDFSHKDLNNG